MDITRKVSLPIHFFQVRLLVVPKLEMWIMNPKVGRTAQELLMAVAMNCTGRDSQDLEVIQNFLKLRQVALD